MKKLKFIIKSEPFVFQIGNCYLLKKEYYYIGFNKTFYVNKNV